jgi:hypothetical protein
MAKQAVAPLQTPTDHQPPHIRLTDESEVPLQALNALMNISVDNAERDALLDSRCKARVQIETSFQPDKVLHSFLDYVPRHAAGRGMLSSLQNDGTLLMTFAVADTSGVSEQLVREFAGDVARILGCSRADIAEATIVEMDDDRLHRALAALGIRQPDLKSV